MNIEFEIPGKPQGKARARTFYNSKLNKMQSVTPANTVLYENLIKLMFRESYKGDMTLNPCKVEITALYGIPKSYSKKKIEEIRSGRLLPTKKPDADNICKCVLDALNGLAYKDDTQVVDVRIIKQYTEFEEKVIVKIKDI